MAWYLPLSIIQTLCGTDKQKETSGFCRIHLQHTKCKNSYLYNLFQSLLDIQYFFKFFFKDTTELTETVLPVKALDKADQETGLKVMHSCVM